MNKDENEKPKGDGMKTKEINEKCLCGHSKEEHNIEGMCGGDDMCPCVNYLTKPHNQQGEK